MNEKCPTCGSPVEIVGHTTMSYKPLPHGINAVVDKNFWDLLDKGGDGMTPHEAVMQFAGYLSTRRPSITVGADREVYQIKEIAQDFCKKITDTKPKLNVEKAAKIIFVAMKHPGFKPYQFQMLSKAAKRPFLEMIEALNKHIEEVME